MSNPEADYLEKFRALVRMQTQLKATIAELAGLNSTLKDWQATAATIGNPGEPQVWSNGLRGVVGLRDHLRDYENQRKATEKAWTSLLPADRVGLASPETLIEKPS
ncbi:MAG TPA: hypothetical protein VHR66_15980 [Gemmataceae bacterium]|jgi:hypothetical protein|nr:hypothetical protein [Gemmataceae bacterium]